MKVALPIWGQRLSPVLDFAHRLLVVEIEKGAVRERCYHPIDPQSSSFLRAQSICSLGIHVVICGSVSFDLKNRIAPRGIRIIPFVAGEVETILQAYLNNTLSDACHRMPGGYAMAENFFGKDVVSMRTYKYIFGPVPSRRFGRSLGIDLTPFKTCSQNCVFCQLGQTTHLTTVRNEYYPLNEILSELKDWIRSGAEADYITLSGSGEPTLHSGFGEVLKFIKKNCSIPTVVLTNGALLHQPEVRDAACRADIVKVTLSATDQHVYEWVNRPHPSLRFEQVIEGQKALRSQYPGKLWLEVFLVDGMNSMPGEVEKLAEIAAMLQPDRIHLNTAVRPPAEDFAEAVSLERLVALAQRFHPAAELIADFGKASAAGASCGPEAIYAMLRRRPCTAHEIAAVFGLHVNEVLKQVGNLLAQKRLRVLRKRNRVYYGTTP